MIWWILFKNCCVFCTKWLYMTYSVIGYGIIDILWIILEMINMLISCQMIFIDGWKRTLYVNTLCSQYSRQSLGNINYVKYIITTDTLTLIFIKHHNTIIIPKGWNEIQFYVYLCRFLLMIKQMMKISWWITGGFSYDVYCYNVKSGRNSKWEIM